MFVVFSIDLKLQTLNTKHKITSSYKNTTAVAL